MQKVKKKFTLVKKKDSQKQDLAPEDNQQKPAKSYSFQEWDDNHIPPAVTSANPDRKPKPRRKKKESPLTSATSSRPVSPVAAASRPPKELPTADPQKIHALVQMIAVILMAHKNNEMYSDDLGVAVMSFQRKFAKRLSRKNIIPSIDGGFMGLKLLKDGPSTRHVKLREMYGRLERASNEASRIVWTFTEVSSIDDDQDLVQVHEKLLDLDISSILPMSKSKTTASEDNMPEIDLENVQPFEGITKSACLFLQTFYYEKIATNLVADARSKILESLGRILNAALVEKFNPPPPLVNVEFFGSSGFKNCDVDMVILVEKSDNTNSTEHRHPYSNMNKVGKVLRKHFADIQVISHARVPIVKFRDRRLGLHCDLNFEHALGVYNSQLLASYTYLDVRVKPLIMLVKYFSKLRNINDASQDTISSYAYTLMVIAFLQDRGILGNLQKEYQGPRIVVKVPDTFHKRGKRREGHRIVDVSFQKVEPVQFDPISVQEAWKGENGIASLFVQFLDYFALKHSYKCTNIVSVKDGGFINTAEAIDDRLLVVLDPFEEDRNCTRMVDMRSLKLIRSEFLYARSLLMSTDDAYSVFK